MASRWPGRGGGWHGWPSRSGRSRRGEPRAIPGRGGWFAPDGRWWTTTCCPGDWRAGRSTSGWAWPSPERKRRASGLSAAGLTGCRRCASWPIWRGGRAGEGKAWGEKRRSDEATKRRRGARKASVHRALPGEVGGCSGSAGVCGPIRTCWPGLNRIGQPAGRRDGGRNQHHVRRTVNFPIRAAAARMAACWPGASSWTRPTMRRACGPSIWHCAAAR